MTTNNTANKIKELQERLDCINSLLIKALILDDTFSHSRELVDQAYDISEGGESPKRVKE